MEVDFSIFQHNLDAICESDMPAASSDLCGDVWKTFEFLPTPPRSPDRDMGLVPEEGLFEGVADLCSTSEGHGHAGVDDALFDPDNATIEDVLGRLTADEKALSDSIDEALSIMKDGDAAVDVLLRDFMWSAPGLDALGLGPRPYEADPLVGAPAPAAGVPAVPPPAFIIIDPTHVFGGAPGHHDDSSDEEDVTGDHEEKPSVGQGQGQDTDGDITTGDEEEEIDVVSVHQRGVKKEVVTSFQPPVRHHVQAPSIPAQPRQSLLAVNRPRPSHVVKREPDDVTPDDVASITSHVAAMHNYFSQSAPQSPTPGYEQARRDAYKRVRSWESHPPSPASLLAKKPRPSSTAADLRSAAGALSRYKQAAAGGRYYGNGQRMGSGSSRCPVNKQRELHNVLERKRRDDLRGNFASLRNILPTMSASRDRMPKVVILRKSREYIRALKVSFQKLSEELANQEARNKQLRRQLAELQHDDFDLC